MKTIIISLLIITAASVTVFGQRAGNTLVAVTVGANFPSGDFASTDLEDGSAGFALTGINLNIMSVYKISRRFGIGGEFTGHSNWVNNAAYQSAFEKEYPDLENWEIIAKRWAGGGLMGGPALTLPFSGSLDFMVRAFAGGVMAYSPEIEIAGDLNDQRQYIRLYEQNKAWAFAFKLGAALMFSMGDRQYFIVGGDYQYAKPTFKDFKVLEYEDPEEPPNVTSRNYTLVMSAFNITIGYGYYL